MFNLSVQEGPILKRIQRLSDREYQYLKAHIEINDAIGNAIAFYEFWST